VVITPTFEDAREVREAGADLIALDATVRAHAAELIRRVQCELACPVMADIATCAEGIAAAQAGAALVATTLYGYTEGTSGSLLPGLDLIDQLARSVTVPVVCEGGVSEPAQVAEAFRKGAFAVVVGTAIAGIEARVRLFASAAQCSRNQLI
jgi:N-acylglucosamine-6-phosphate 2-epimerase